MACIPASVRHRGATVDSLVRNEGAGNRAGPRNWHKSTSHQFIVSSRDAANAKNPRGAP